MDILATCTFCVRGPEWVRVCISVANQNYLVKLNSKIFLSRQLDKKFLSSFRDTNSDFHDVTT